VPSPSASGGADQTSANQWIRNVNSRCDSLGMGLRDIKAERTCHQLEQEATRLSN
jgi:hypothetical protein